jgi:hypothetical protein
MADHLETSRATGIEVQGHQNVTIIGNVGDDVIVTTSLPVPGAVCVYAAAQARRRDTDRG